jgi:hypothetical protein
MRPDSRLFKQRRIGIGSQSSIDHQADNLQLHSTSGREIYRQHLTASIRVVTHCTFFSVNKISTLEYSSGRLFTSVKTLIGEKDKTHKSLTDLPKALLWFEINH